MPKIIQKALTHKLIRSTDGNFGTHWTYMCDNGRPIEASFEENFFSTLWSNLLPGDTIRVVETKKKKLVAAYLAIVVAKHETLPEVDVQPYDDTGVRRFTPVGCEEVKLEPMEPGPVFVSGTVQAEYSQRDHLWKVKDGGKVVFETENKAEAKAVARGDMPIPQLA